MIASTTLRRGFSLLTDRERIHFVMFVVIAIVSGLASAGMIASVFPFLTVLSEPSRIADSPTLSFLRDQLGAETDYEFLLYLGAFCIVAIITASLLNVLRVIVANRFTASRHHSISRSLLQRYLFQEYSFFIGQNTGDMSAKILNESVYVVNFFFRPMVEIITASASVLAISAVVVAVNPVVAAAMAFSLGGIFLAIFLVSRRRLARLGKARVELNQQRFRVAGESFNGVKTIKMIDGETEALRQYDKYCRAMATSQYRMQILTEAPQYVVQGAVFGGAVLLCLLVIDPAGLQSGMEIRSLVPVVGVFAFASQRLIPELTRLYRGFSQLRFGGPAVDAVFAADVPRATPTPPASADTRLRLRCDLTLDRVSFHYPNATRAALHSVSLKIEAGEKIGIVGASGAGKSTLADLLLGLLKPDEGAIIVDGETITRELLPRWRRSISYVPQETFLIDASIEDNIALGGDRGNADQARIKLAGRLAQLDAVVRDLPEGYNAMIGEKGVRLSGGQRQRVNVARAFYRDGDLFLFDEATAALDTLTERSVTAAIRSLGREKTVVIIAHRLSTVRMCDRIIVMKDGRVEGFDSFDALLQNNPTFRALAESGAEEFDSEAHAS